jgi:hypothetical protein
VEETETSRVLLTKEGSVRGAPLWNNNRLLLKLAVLVLTVAAPVYMAAAEVPDHSPQLLLTAQRLRRLKRDRERQTQRWVNFENRVNSMPDSPERGFELALYYAVTGDGARGKEAVQWALAHGCERRQAALVLDWTGPLIAVADRSKLAAQNCPDRGLQNPTSLRDAVFLKIAAGEDISKLVEDSRKQITAFLADGGFQDAGQLYAASEYVMAVRDARHVDVREDDSTFFLQLPVEFLLALKPGQLDHPGWMTHVAALALVAVDPNLESSQFLQGWAIADRQMAREGAGVAYELLWADPYLPGIGYQNMNRWAYDARGHLFARMDWEPNSCYIEISTSGVKEENCPPGWRDAAATFGRLTLLPMPERCVELPRVRNGDSLIVWKLKPHEIIHTEQANIEQEKQHKQPQESSAADAAGMWHVPMNITGKACTAAR